MAFQEGSLSSGVEINTFMFRFTSLVAFPLIRVASQKGFYCKVCKNDSCNLLLLKCIHVKKAPSVDFFILKTIVSSKQKLCFFNQTQVNFCFADVLGSSKANQKS